MNSQGNPVQHERVAHTPGDLLPFNVVTGRRKAALALRLSLYDLDQIGPGNQPGSGGRSQSGQFTQQIDQQHGQGVEGDEQRLIDPGGQCRESGDKQDYGWQELSSILVVVSAAIMLLMNLCTLFPNIHASSA
ncbi:hypothetical protein M1N87_02005, partial [Dehalococcoidia bacterium]|nr:hypothetical protein [Dehalococcoidia bacterium]